MNAESDIHIIGSDVWSNIFSYMQFTCLIVAFFASMIRFSTVDANDTFDISTCSTSITRHDAFKTANTINTPQVIDVTHSGIYMLVSDIWNNIFSYMQFTDLIRLSQTSKHIYTMCKKLSIETFTMFLSKENLTIQTMLGNSFVGKIIQSSLYKNQRYIMSACDVFYVKQRESHNKYGKQFHAFVANAIIENNWDVVRNIANIIEYFPFTMSIKDLYELAIESGKSDEFNMFLSFFNYQQYDNTIISCKTNVLYNKQQHMVVFDELVKYNPYTYIKKDNNVSAVTAIERGQLLLADKKACDMGIENAFLILCYLFGSRDMTEFIANKFIIYKNYLTSYEIDTYLSKFSDPEFPGDNWIHVFGKYGNFQEFATYMQKKRGWRSISHSIKKF